MCLHPTAAHTFAAGVLEADGNIAGQLCLHEAVVSAYQGTDLQDLVCRDGNGGFSGKLVQIQNSSAVHHLAAGQSLGCNMVVIQLLYQVLYVVLAAHSLRTSPGHNAGILAAPKSPTEKKGF